MFRDNKDIRQRKFSIPPSCDPKLKCNFNQLRIHAYRFCVQYIYTVYILAAPWAEFLASAKWQKEINFLTLWPAS